MVKLYIFYVCVISKKILIWIGVVVVLVKFNYIVGVWFLYDFVYGFLYFGFWNDCLGFIFNISIILRKCNLIEFNIF